MLRLFACRVFTQSTCLDAISSFLMFPHLPTCLSHINSLLPWRHSKFQTHLAHLGSQLGCDCCHHISCWFRCAIWPAQVHSPALLAQRSLNWYLPSLLFGRLLQQVVVTDRHQCDHQVVTSTWFVVCVSDFQLQSPFEDNAENYRNTLKMLSQNH